MDNLTPQEGFRAMFLFLDAFYRETSGTANIGEVLGELNPAIDGKSSDPAAWENWLEAVRVARSG
jgi:hypothetical protein